MPNFLLKRPGQVALVLCVLGGFVAFSQQVPSHAGGPKQGGRAEGEWDGIGQIKRYSIVCRDTHIVTENPDSENDELKLADLVAYESRSQSHAGIQLEYTPRYKNRMELLLAYDPDNALNLNTVDDDAIVLDLSKAQRRPVQADDLLGVLKGKERSVFIAWLKSNRLVLLWKDTATGKYLLKARFVAVPNVGDTLGQTGTFNPPPPNYTPPPAP